jgi:hypothetical protein
MEDIISQGGDRDPSRWPRRLALIGAPILVAVASIGYLTLARHPHSPAATPPTPVTASTAPVSVNLDAPGLADEPDGIAGPTLPWAGSLRLPVAGTQPAWLSPATGRSAAIGGLPADNSGYQFTRVDGGWAVQASFAGNKACPDCAGPPQPVWFLADGTGSVTRIGPANQVAPAATAGAMWLTSYPLGAATGTAAPVAREVSLTGTPLAPPVKLPAGYVIDQATERGLLLAPVTQHPGAAAYKLWNPADPRASRTFGDVVAASPAEIAWAPTCAAACQVRVLNLSTGRQAVVKLPAGSSASGAAFSPSGNLLALQLSSGDDGALAMRLDVASVASGRLTPVPGTSVSSDALVGFGWPTSGDRLVAEFIFATKVQVASWQPGATRLGVAVIRPGPDDASLVVG